MKCCLLPAKFRNNLATSRQFVGYNLNFVERKPAFCICENKGADQLIRTFVFPTYIVQYLFFLYPKFLASSGILLLYSRVCVGPGRTPGRRFSHGEAHLTGDMSKSHKSHHKPGVNVGFTLIENLSAPGLMD